MSVFDIFKKLEGQKQQPAMPVSWIIAGLGNPGKKYERTRHNAGFCAVDYLAEKLGVPLTRIKFKGLCGEGVINGQRVLLIKPQTFMNLSGECVSEAAGFYKIPNEHIIVFSDDISLPIGKIRVRAGGSAGGHNGLKNIAEKIGSTEFPRIKIGVGAPPTKQYDLADWVLSGLCDADFRQMSDAAHKASDAAVAFISDGIQAAMQKFN